MTNDSGRLADVAVVAVVVVTGIRFNTPGLGLGNLVSPASLGMQAFVVGLAVVLVLLYPAHLIRATSRLATKLLLAFYLFAIVSTFWSADPSRTVAQGATAFGSLLIISIHAEANGWQSTRALLTRLFVAVLLLGTLVDLLADSDEARWSGVSGAATQLAQFSVITGLFALLGWIRRCETAFFTWAVVALCTGEVIMSQSRAALTTMALVAMWAIWFRLPRTVRPVASVGLASAAAAIASVLINQLRQLALRDSSVASDLTEFTGRTAIWPEAFDAFLVRPLAGFGFASGEVVWADRVLIGHLNWYPSNAHNIALETMLSLGVIGLLLLVAFFGSVFAARQSAERYAASAMVVVSILLGATEAMLHYASPTTVVLALSAAALASSNGSSNKGSAALANRLWVRTS